ncbi:MAG: tetratricopeptide repeat protein [Pyrinomonadaceae bacterium]
MKSNNSPQRRRVSAELAQRIEGHSITLRKLCVRLCASAVNSNLIYTQVALTLFLILLIPLNTHAQANTTIERLERAASLISENRTDEAEQQLNSILKLAPNEAAALNLLGTIRAKQGKLDEAETLFTRAVRADNQLTGAHMNLAYLYLLKGVPEKTALELREALRLDPDNADAAYKLAWVLFSQGRYDECIALIEKTKQSHALSVPLLVVLGDAYLKKGDVNRAGESYLLVINEQSGNADALMGLARVAQAKGDAKNASLYLNRAKDSIADSPDLLYKFALAALNSNLTDDAMPAIKRAIELRPETPSYYFVLGTLWLRAAKPDLQEAEQAFRKFLKYQPDNAQGQMSLGYVLLKQKRYAEARELLERSAQKETRTPDTFYYLGLIAQEQSEDERAVELFEKAIQLQPAHAYAHIALGSAYLKLKNYTRAQQELETGVKLSPDDSKAHYNLALLYARQKDRQRAQEEMRIVEKLKSEGKAEPEESETAAPSPSSPR